MIETNRIEFKRELTRDLDIEKEVVSFLNYREGGIIYIGVDDNGKPVGVKDIDGDMLKVKDRIRMGVSPSPMGLFDVTFERINEIPVIKIFVASGSEKPYYKNKYGLSEKGCFIRVGTAAEPMTQAQIDDLYAHRTHTSLRNIPAPRQDLTFQQLMIYYQSKYRPLGENFAKTLLFLTEDGKYNYVAYLFSDENDVSFKVAKYAGTDRDRLIANNEYGYCCLLKAADAVIERLRIENIVSTQKTYLYRQDVPLWDSDAIRELVLNAFIHNDYFSEVPPKFELFSDRLEITSTGTLPSGLLQEEFFEGVSVPRNKEIMRIFRDVQMGEALGSGMRLVMSKYSKDNFVFMPHFIRVCIPFATQKIEGLTTTILPQNTTTILPQKTTSKKVRRTTIKSANSKGEATTKHQILQILSDNPATPLSEIAKTIGCSKDNITYHIKGLRAKGMIIHKGPTNGGYWLVLATM